MFNINTLWARSQAHVQICQPCHFGDKCHISSRIHFEMNIDKSSRSLISGALTAKVHICIYSFPCQPLLLWLIWRISFTHFKWWFIFALQLMRRDTFCVILPFKRKEHVTIAINSYVFNKNENTKNQQHIIFHWNETKEKKPIKRNRSDSKKKTVRIQCLLMNSKYNYYYYYHLHRVSSSLSHLSQILTLSQIMNKRVVLKSDF